MAEKPRLLIVDDEEDILISLRGVLRRLYQVETADSGDAALKLLESASAEFPLVISDQRMPGMFGHEFLKEVHERYPETLGFLLTGYTDFDDLIHAVNEGHIYTYLSKPVDPEDLKLRLERALQLYNTRDQNRLLKDELQEINRTLETRIERQTEQLRKQLQLIEDDLEQARHTQLSLLPAKLPNSANLRTASRFAPMEQVGGDFYDVVALPGGKTGFIVADVTGHGIAAAMISFMLSIVFKMVSSSEDSPRKTVEQGNDLLCGRMPEGKFASLFYCVYDPENGLMRYTSAGHPPAFVVRPDGELEELNSKGLVLGMLPSEMAGFEEKSMQLEKGDKVLLYTDGILEVNFRRQGEQEQGLAWKQLYELLRNHHRLDIAPLLERIEHGILEMAQQTGYDDDITLLGFEVPGDAT